MKNFGKIYSLKTHSLSLVLLLFTFYECIFVPSSALVPVEQDVLLGIKEVWNDPDFVLSSWTRDNDCSYWNGITCDEDGHVIELIFYNSQFSYSISSSIGNLTSLQKLVLHDANLFGPIPDSFRNLRNLTYLDLAVNKINGSFPSSILTLKNIQYLALGFNLLNGPLPSSIANLTNLVELHLQSCQFFGLIPLSIGKLTKLQILNLRNNFLVAPIPNSFRNLRNLNYLDLSVNNINGSFPYPIHTLRSILEFNFSQSSSDCVPTSSATQPPSPPDCSSFCGANSIAGACGGHGTCALSALNIYVCTCDPGWALPNCDQSEENSTSPSPSPSPSISLSTSASTSSSSSPSPSPSKSASTSSSSSPPPSPPSPPSPSPALNLAPTPLSPSPSLSPESTLFSPIASSYFPLPSPYSPSPKPSNTNLGLIFGITSPIVLCLIIFAIFVCLLFRKYKKKDILLDNISIVLTKKKFKDEIQKLSLSCFSLREILTMTRWFDVNMTLGSGGFGTVFKGIMPGGELCGVKRAHLTSIQSLNDFQKEVFALAELNHFNIVKLLGYCDEANENILVYEYVENGSLSKMLRLPKDHPHFLNFEKRVQIAKDCALGLHYLHNLSNKQLIHRDVKSDNILLDAKFTAKIADFGLLKIQDENLSAIKTSPCGTPGYVDPEYFKTLTLTNKSDVYSFGVVLLELITGKPSIFVIDDPEAPNGKLNQSLVSWARPILQSNNLYGLIDPNLKEEHEPASLQSMASLAASCLRPSQKERPGMYEVSSRLGVILYGKDLEIQEGESHAMNAKGDPGEFFLTYDHNVYSSNSSISNRVPVMSKSFRPR